MAMLFLIAFSAGASDQLETRWVRNSVEYSTLTQQIYAGAAQAVTDAKREKKPWVVVLDVDETALDNSAYQLEMAAYGTSFDFESWNAWCERRAAPAVPGAVAFVETVRGAGGQIVYITNRSSVTDDATRANLTAVGLWQEGDVLCTQTEDKTYDKVTRRGEVRTGTGSCSIGKPAHVVAYIGDTITDFPDAEEAPDIASPFGTQYFLLPNPMYGSWMKRVTRPLP